MSGADDDNRARLPEADTEDFPVKVNVGGSIFETMRSTLVENSTYFEAHFSFQSRRERHGCCDQRASVFIDQDPDGFRVLLSFFRNETIPIGDLNRTVLLLAEYLGVEKLLRATKLLMARGMKLVPQNSSVQDAIDAFDHSIANSFQSLSHEEVDDHLKIAKESPGDLDFATMYLHIPEKDYGTYPDDRKVDAPPYRAGLRTLFHFQKLKGERPSVDRRTDKGGFFLPIFALNWLGRHGFQVAPESFQKYYDKSHIWDKHELGPEESARPDSLGRFLEEMLFVRSTVHDANVSEEERKLRFAISGVKRSENLKEYAILNASITINSDVFVQCASPLLLTIPRLDGTEARTSVRCHFPDMAQAMEWLNRNGFYQQEPELEGFLSRAQRRAKDDFFGPTLVFSRKLRAKAPETDLLHPTHVGVSFPNRVKGRHGWIVLP